MKCAIEHYGNGWSEIRIEVNEDEINRMIDLLERIRDKKMDHFHAVNKFEEKSGVADIEISVMIESEKNNMILD
jgi:hypothetical protein